MYWSQTESSKWSLDFTLHHLAHPRKASHPNLEWIMDRAVEGTRCRPDYRPLIHMLGIKSHDLVIETGLVHYY